MFLNYTLKKLFLASVIFISLFSNSVFGSQTILIGIPAAQSGPAGVADHQDWTNGALMAIEEINANGGVLGKQLEAKIIDMDILTPEGGIAAMQTLIESKVHAIASAFTILPQPAMDAAAPSGGALVHRLNTRSEHL